MWTKKGRFKFSTPVSPDSSETYAFSVCLFSSIFCKYLKLLLVIWLKLFDTTFLLIGSSILQILSYYLCSLSDTVLVYVEHTLNFEKVLK